MMITSSNIVKVKNRKALLGVLNIFHKPLDWPTTYDMHILLLICINTLYYCKLFDG